MTTVAPPVSNSTDYAVVIRKSVRGGVAVVGRDGGARVIGLAGTIVLARILSPADFGVYAIMLFVLALLNAIGDGGLGASLIRQPAPPSAEDYHAVFTAQTAVAVAFGAALALAAVMLQRVGTVSGDVRALLFLVAIAVVVTTLRAVPAMVLERNLDFGRLMAAGLTEAIAFNVVVVALAVRGYGVVAFGFGLVAQAAVGTAVTFGRRKWPLGLRWDAARVRHHLGFGVPYQGVLFLSLAKDAVMPVGVGLLAGATAVGYVRFSQAVAAFGLFVLQALSRLYLPAFARLQGRREDLGRLVERAIDIGNLIVAPIAVLILVLSHPLVRDVFGAKWLAALPVVILLWGANLFVPTTAPLLSLFSAVGRPNVAFRFALLWMVLTWILGVPLVAAFGAVGFGVANLLVQLTNLLLIRRAREVVDFAVLRPILRSWLPAAAMGLVIAGIAHMQPPRGLMSLGSYCMIGLVVFGVASIATRPHDVGRVCTSLRGALR